MLDNKYALLFIRGERPVMDLKYDIMKHPAIDMTSDGKAAPYVHGEAKDAGATIELVYDPELISEAAENAPIIELPDTDYVLLSEAEVEKEIKNIEETAQTSEKNPEETELMEVMNEGKEK